LLGQVPCVLFQSRFSSTAGENRTAKFNLMQQQTLPSSNIVTGMKMSYYFLNYEKDNNKTGSNGQLGC
jgi:hypothetical protein